MHLVAPLCTRIIAHEGWLWRHAESPCRTVTRNEHFPAVRELFVVAFTDRSWNEAKHRIGIMHGWCLQIKACYWPWLGIRVGLRPMNIPGQRSKPNIISLKCNYACVQKTIIRDIKGKLNRIFNCDIYDD